MSKKDRKLPPPRYSSTRYGNAVLVAPVVDVQDVAVVQRGRQSGLGLELPQEGGVTGQGRVKELDSDASAEARVVSGEDLGRGTGADHGE